MGLRNQTFDDRDTTNLRYAGGWPVPNDGSWNASSVGESGTLSSTKDPTANITFTFPVPANAIYYYGIPRCCGGLYAICVDCDPNAPVFETIDAVNRTDNGQNPPVVLWSRTFTNFGIHEIILTNQNDPRFGNNSQITIDKFDLQVEDDSSTATTTVGAASPNTASPTTATEPETAPSSSPPPPLSSSSSSSPSSSAPVGAIVGGVLGGIAVIAVTIFIWLFLRRRTARRISAEAPPMSEPQPFFPSTLTSRPAPPERPQKGATSSTNGAGRGRGQGYGYSKRNLGANPQLSTTTSETSAAESTSRIELHTSPVRSPMPPRLPRRETDAGRIPEDEFDVEEEETLPPEYDQVFRRNDGGGVNAQGGLSVPVQSTSSGVGVLTGTRLVEDHGVPGDTLQPSPRRRKF